MIVLKLPRFFSHCSYKRVKKRGNFKTNVLFYSMESFLYWLSYSKVKVLKNRASEEPKVLHLPDFDVNCNMIA